LLEFVVLCLDNQGRIVYVQATIEVLLFWIPAFSRNTTLLMEVFKVNHFPELGHDVPGAKRSLNSVIQTLGLKPTDDLRVTSDQ